MIRYRCASGHCGYGAFVRVGAALLLIVVFALSSLSLAGGGILSYAVSLGSVYGVDVPSLGASLLLVGVVGFLLFAVLLGVWAFRRGRSRIAAVDNEVTQL